MTTLYFSDGVTTIDLYAGTGYALLADTWSPRVARRRVDTLGGPIHEDVIEEMTISISADTAGLPHTRLETLDRLITQGERFRRGENVAPVLLYYQPDGSSIVTNPALVAFPDSPFGPLRALVLGYADGGMTIAERLYDLQGVINEIVVTVQFIRRGQWLAASASVTGTNDTNPAVLTATFGYSAPDLCPVKVTLGTFGDANANGTILPGFVFVANHADRINLLDAGTMTASGYTLDTDVAAKPHGAGVLRYTPTTTNPATSGTKVVNGSPRRIGIVANLRNNSLTATWRIKVNATAHLYGTVSTTEYVVDATSQLPQRVMLGIVRADFAIERITLTITASTVTGPPTLDIDTLIAIDLDDPSSRIVGIGPITIAARIPLPDSSNLILDPRPLTDLTPSVTVIDATTPTFGTQPDYHRGDPYLMTRGTTVAALYLAANSTYWRLVDESFSTVRNQSLSVYRWPGWVTPA